MLQGALHVSRQPLFGRYEALAAPPRKVGEGSRCRGGRISLKHGGGQDGAVEWRRISFGFHNRVPWTCFEGFSRSFLFMNIRISCIERGVESRSEESGCLFDTDLI